MNSSVRSSHQAAGNDTCIQITSILYHPVPLALPYTPFPNVMAAPPSTVLNGTDSPVFSPTRSLWERLTLSIKLRLLKVLVKVYLTIRNLPGIRNKAILPSFTKVYPCQPNLTNRVFIPKSYKSDDALLPLYLDIHGGGFALGSPVLDDPFSSNFANDNKVIVISLDYPKAPSHPYPAAVDAITDLINSILKDETLPFDKKKIAIGGFSAGANLALAVTQKESLQGKVRAVVAYYPPLDFVTNGREKLLTRPVDAPPDLLEHSMAMFDYGYAKVGQDLRDPLLSPSFAQRNNLPPKLCLIGCEFDLLCREAEIFAEKMAGVGSGERTGSDLLWEKNGVRWEKILGEEHGMSSSCIAS